MVWLCVTVMHDYWVALSLQVTCRLAADVSRAVQIRMQCIILVARQLDSMLHICGPARYIYPSPSHSNTPNPTQIIPTPHKVCISGMCPIQMASVIATRPIVRRLATDEVVGPQIPIKTISPAFCKSAHSLDRYTEDSHRQPRRLRQPPRRTISY